MLSLYRNKSIKLFAQSKIYITFNLHEFPNLASTRLRLIVAVNEYDDSRAFVCRWQFVVEKNNKSEKKETKGEKTRREKNRVKAKVTFWDLTRVSKTQARATCRRSPCLSSHVTVRKRVEILQPGLFVARLDRSSR